MDCIPLLLFQSRFGWGDSGGHFKRDEETSCLKYSKKFLMNGLGMLIGTVNFRKDFKHPSSVESECHCRTVEFEYSGVPMPFRTSIPCRCL